jgi:quercetin dioxygenase-like cupin family protein
MARKALGLGVVGFAALALASVAAIGAEGPTVKRTVLLQQDIAGGMTMSEVQVEIPVGGREGRHMHPGPLMVHVVEGQLTLDYEGKPTLTYKPGDTFFVEAGKIHEGINRGNVGIRAIATFVTEKGKPLTTQAQ